MWCWESLQNFCQGVRFLPLSLSCLDFHHTNPDIKEVDVSQIIYRKGWGKQKLLEEIAKCRVLCSNCHRKLHWQEKRLMGVTDSIRIS